MRRSLLLGILFLAVACAHQPIDRHPAVKVVVTASPEAAQIFGTDAFERMMKRELRGATMPTPRPLTLTVNIDSTDRISNGPKVALVSGRPIAWRSFFTPSGNSMRGAADSHSSGWPRDPEEAADWQLTTRQLNSRQKYSNDGPPVVVGTYTITDESGSIREEQPIVMLAVGPEYHDARAQMQSMRAAAQYLADRVIAVDAITRTGHNFDRRGGR
jgi:hypothetical protein